MGRGRGKKEGREVEGEGGLLGLFIGYWAEWRPSLLSLRAWTQREQHCWD